MPTYKDKRKMGLLDLFSSGEVSDDVKLLPIQFQSVYKTPYKALGLDVDNTDISLLRDTFRKNCIALIPHFSGFSKTKLTESQLNFAYHLVRGTIKGPAQLIAESMSMSPVYDFQAHYILPILRPIGGDVKSKDYRACQMLTVSMVDYRTTIRFAIIPKTIYVFDVHYVMRRHKIERDFESFQMLNNELSKELLALPLLPEADGEKLAEYIMRIHSMLAHKGVFSPRLMSFLDIDYQRVQTEEEGAIIQLLDSAVRPPNTVWYMIDEQWLVKWRKFVLGRGPRRYLPPGRISNQYLVEQLRKNRKDITKAKEYRCVNFNVWRLYELVHGGGPAIARQEQDIYSSKGISFLHAIILVQNRIRIYLCKKQRMLLYMKRLSTCQVAKAVIVELSRENVRSQAEQILREQRAERVKRNLDKAAEFTQHLWRLKKKYLLEENLEVKRQEQEVFSKVKGLSKDVPHSVTDAVVISDLQPIVHIGTTNIYTRVIRDGLGVLPFSVTRYPGTEEAVIASTKDENFMIGSKILSINDFPTDPISYDEVKSRLICASYPIVLQMQKPLNNALIPTLDSILALKLQANDTTVQFNAFKILLSHGIPMIKHNNGNLSQHLTILRISNKELLYRRRLDPRKELGGKDEQWSKFSLFQLKFVLEGKDSEKARRKFLNPRHCVELITEERGLLFELPSPQKLKKLRKEEIDAARKRRAAQLAAASYSTKSFSSSSATAAALLRDSDSAVSFNMDVDLEEESPPQKAKAAEEDLAVDESTISGGGGNSVSSSGVASLSAEESHAAKCSLIVDCLRQLVTEIRGSQIFVDKQGMPIRRMEAKVVFRKLEN